MEKIKYIGRCLLAKIGKERILVAGDLHLGYEEYLNNEGIFVSRRMYSEMTEKFDKIFDRIGKVDEVVLLGDVKHSFGKIMKQEKKWNFLILSLKCLKKVNVIL